MRTSAATKALLFRFFFFSNRSWKIKRLFTSLKIARRPFRNKQNEEMILKSVVWGFTLLYFLSINILDCSNSIAVLDCHRCFRDSGPLWWQRFRKQPRWICRLQSDVKGMEAAGLINLLPHKASFPTKMLSIIIFIFVMSDVEFFFPANSRLP